MVTVHDGVAIRKIIPVQAFNKDRSRCGVITLIIVMQVIIVVIVLKDGIIYNRLGAVDS